tara:strand:+ start:88 stop:336 length:249 start_codon:yes stop_codon:yes gene_type:complete
MSEDLLRIDYINSFSQPFMACLTVKNGAEYMVENIDVETGFLKIDVMGQYDVIHVSDVKYFIDDDGLFHSSDSFFSDYEMLY